MSDVLEERRRYRCENPACSLGAVGEPGHFTGGMTAEGLHVLTGRPVEELEEGVDHGDGFCPNCGKPGVPEDEPHLVMASDPNATPEPKKAAKKTKDHEVSTAGDHDA